MNSADNAIQQSLLLQRHPEILFELQQAPLPEGMATLIRLVTDEGSFRDGLAQTFGVDGEQLRQAAASYLRSICLFPGSQGLRVLALNDARDMRLAKDHHRLLIKWLHPDRNSQNQALAERVNQAWSQLKAKRHAEPASALADSWPVRDRRTLPKSRFNWFIGGLVALSGLLLLLSLLPDQEVYVSGINADKALGATEPDLADEEVNAPLASLRHLAWAEPTRSGSKPEVSVTPISTQKAGSEKMLKINPFSKPNTSKPNGNQTAVTKGLEKTALRLTSAPDKSTVKSLPVAVPDEHSRVDVATKPQITPGLSMADASAMLPLFVSRYRQGNIARFMELFSRDARNNSGDRNTIAEDYGQLFAGSQRRDLDISQLQWLRQGDDIALQARYRSKVRREGELLAVTNKGRIQLLFVNEGGKARIQSILIGE